MRNCTIVLALAVSVVLALGTSGHAAITWNVAGGGNWNTVTPNWTGDSTTFTDNGTVDVIFNKTNGGTITISPNMSPLTTTVSAASGTYTFTGGPIDSGSLSKSGGGTLVLSGANTYTGTTDIIAGVLNIRNNTALGPLSTSYGTMTKVQPGAALQVQGGITSPEFIYLYGTGVANDGAVRNISGDNTFSSYVNINTTSANNSARINSDSGTLYLPGNNNSPISGNMGATNLSLTFGGAGNITVAAGISAYDGGILALIKDGAGTLTLSGTNAYTGTTTVSDGTLKLGAGGSHTGAGGYTVVAGATLQVDGALTLAGAGGVEAAGTVSGSGTITGWVDIAGVGILSPGASEGELTITADLGLEEGFTYDWELGTSDYDTVSVGGTLSFPGAAWTLALHSDGGAEPVAGTKYYLFEATTIDGFNAGHITLDEGDVPWDMSEVSYGVDGTGMYMMIPEPNTLALLATGLLGLLLFARRRRRR